MSLGDANNLTYALMRKADIANDLGQADRAVSLTEAALRKPAQVEPAMAALVLRLRGRAHAQLGNASECARALDGALLAVMRTGREPDGLTDYCTPGYIGMEAASAWSTLGRFDTAVATFERSLPSWPAPLRRDQGLCLARLANAHAGRGDLGGACEAGRQAVNVVSTALANRALIELQRVRVRLAPVRRHAEVSDLSDRIRGLLQPAA